MVTRAKKLPTICSILVILVWRSSFWPGDQAPQRGVVIHVIKEVERVRQQEEQEVKRDEEIRDEENGEVEEITHRAHET